MSVLLIGHWDGDTLTVTESHFIEDEDEEAIDEILDRPDRDELWACEFLVDRHWEAIQGAYDQEIAFGDSGDLVDKVWGFEPIR